MEGSARYNVKIGGYEGPLELLLDLIESRKFLINEVSLAAVADDYIAYVKRFEKMPIADVAQFLLVASTLLLIKSKSLLPALSLTDEEAGNIKDLEWRLAVYRSIRELSRHVASHYGAAPLFEGSVEEPAPLFAPAGNTTAAELRAALLRVLASVPVPVRLPSVAVSAVVSLEEMIERLLTRVKAELHTSFRTFAGVGTAGKVDIIVSFLALLELVKQGSVRARQGEEFQDIAIEHDAVETPRYAKRS